MAEPTLNIESEEFTNLLAEALRAGPASPQWHQAVGILGAHGSEGDQYKLLCAARERLESGKEYRSVRAGPGFGKKVMEGIGAQGQRRRGPSTLSLIVGAAVLTILIVLAAFIYRVLPGVSQQQKIKQLTEGTYYTHDVQAARFESVIPEGWQTLGELQVKVRDKELRLEPAGNPAATAPAVLAGGLVCTTPLAADGVYSISAVFRFNHTADETGTVRLFISDEPITSGHPSGEHELVCQVKSGEVRVALPGKSVCPEFDQVADLREVAVRILINRDLAVVDGPRTRTDLPVEKQHLYAGASGLAPDKPRYVGVEFLRRNGDKSGHLGVASIVIQKP